MSKGKKVKEGHTFVTVKGIRWRVKGTGHAWSTLLRKVKAGEATEAPL